MAHAYHYVWNITSLPMIIYFILLGSLDLYRYRSKSSLHGEELIALGSPSHFHRLWRCSRQIWRSFDVWTLAACLPDRSSWIWPPKVGESTLKGSKMGPMRATFALTNIHFDNKVLAFGCAGQSCNLSWWFGISYWLINNRVERRNENNKAGTGCRHRPVPIEKPLEFCSPISHTKNKTR